MVMIDRTIHWSHIRIQCLVSKASVSSIPLNVTGSSHQYTVNKKVPDRTLFWFKPWVPFSEPSSKVQEKNGFALNFSFSFKKRL